MVARTPSQAVKAFLQPLSAAVAVVTRETLVADGYEPGGPYTVTFRAADVGVGVGSNFRLALTHNYRVVRQEGASARWRATTAG